MKELNSLLKELGIISESNVEVKNDIDDLNREKELVLAKS